MASKRKFSHESDDGVTGYITDVSPLKLARNEKTRFFTAEMHTSKTESRRVVCFTPEKHQMFKSAETSPDAFVLKKAKVQPGRDGKMEIKCFRECDLESSSKKLQFTKDYKSLLHKEEKSQVLTLDELKDDYQMGSINVKFLGFEEREKNVHTKYGPMKVHLAVVADTTATRRMTIWSNELVQYFEKGMFYSISCVQNKLFNEENNINTTNSTKVTSIPPFEEIKEDLAFLKEQVMENAHFLSVVLNSSKKCSVCKRTVNLSHPKPDIFRCLQCNYKQLVESLDTKISVTGYVSNGTTPSKKVTILEDVIHEYLSKKDKLCLMANEDALEDYIILNRPYRLTFCGRGEIVSNLSSD